MTSVLFGSLVFVLIVLILSLVVLGARRLMVPTGAVTVTVNSDQALEARGDQRLLGVLTGAGIPVPSPCGGVGACGLCRVHVTEGGGEPLSTEANKLSRRDLRDGLRLACQVTTRNDLAVEVSEDLLSVESWQCKVKSSRSLSPFIRELVFELPEGANLDFRAGAFVQVSAPAFTLRFSDLEIPEAYREQWDQYALRDIVLNSEEPVTRAYSLANTPADDGMVVLNIRLALPPPSAGEQAPPGIVSSYLFSLKPGDEVAVSGPYGDFGAQDTEREMVFIGGGVGMAPLRAIIFEQLEKYGSSRKMSYWYGARTPIELFYEDEFDGLHEKHANFDWTVAMSDVTLEERGDRPVGFIHNVVHDLYLADHPAPEDCEYYLCGPPLMISAVMAMLDDLGVDRSSIYNDDFGG